MSLKQLRARLERIEAKRRGRASAPVSDASEAKARKHWAELYKSALGYPVALQELAPNGRPWSQLAWMDLVRAEHTVSGFEGGQRS